MGGKAGTLSQGSGLSPRLKQQGPFFAPTEPGQGCSSRSRGRKSGPAACWDSEDKGGGEGPEAWALRLHSKGKVEGPSVMCPPRYRQGPERGQSNQGKQILLETS